MDQSTRIRSFASLSSGLVLALGVLSGCGPNQTIAANFKPARRSRDRVDQ